MKLPDPKWSVFLLALVIRILFCAFFRETFLDSGRMVPLYILASNIADHGRFCSDREFFDAFGYSIYIEPPLRNDDFYKVAGRIGRMPRCRDAPEITDTWGYAVLLGLFWKVIPVRTYIPMQLLQAVLDSFAALCIVLIATMLFRREKAAFWAGAAYACFPPFALLSVIASRDYYAAWGAIFSLYFFLRNVKDRRSITGYLLCGVAIALFSWFRPTIFLLPAVFALSAVLLVKKRRIMNAVKSGLGTGIPVILFFALPFGWQYNNAYGTWNFTEGVQGGILWEGLGRFSSKYHFSCNDLDAYRRAVALGYPEGAPSWVPAYSRILKKDAMNVIREDPFWYAGTVLKRYVRFFFARPPFPLSEFSNISYEETGLPLATFIFRHPVIAVEKAVKTAGAFLLPLLAVASLVLLRKERKKSLVLLLFWQYRILVSVGTHLEDRYVMECYFPVVALTALGLGTFFQKRKSGCGGAGISPNAGSLSEFCDTYERHLQNAVSPAGRNYRFYLHCKAELVLAAVDGPSRNNVSVLDFGCGKGLMDRYLGEHLPNLTGADLSFPLVVHARRHNPHVGYSCCGGSNLPFARDTFDVVFASCVFHHIPETRRPGVMAELAAVLKPGGKVLLFEHNPWNPITRMVVDRCPFDDDAVLLPGGKAEELMRKAGLTVIERRYILFFPFGGLLFGSINRLLGWLPLGAQYMCVGQRPLR